eukprot:2867713-Prymnesium_polylepis.1
MACCDGWAHRGAGAPRGRADLRWARRSHAETHGARADAAHPGHDGRHRSHRGVAGRGRVDLRRAHRGVA